MTNEFRETDPSYQEPELTPNAMTVLKDRYLQKNEQGANVETAKDLFYRVAAATASGERPYNGDEKKWRKRFYNLMATGEFMPNSPTLMNAGRNDNLLSACISGDAPVLTRYGYVPMKEIVLMVERGETVIVSSGQGTWVRVRVAARQGVRPVYRHYMGSSRVVDSTLDHRYQYYEAGKGSGSKRVPGEFVWEEIGKIPEGKYIKEGVQGEYPRMEQTLDLEIALAAWILTDGGCNWYPQSKGNSEFFVGEIQVIDSKSLDHVVNLMDKLGFSYTQKEEEGVGGVERFTRIRSYDRNLAVLCEKYGLFSRKDTKTLPPQVESSNYLTKKEFLKVIFEADGCISSTGIGFQTVSKELAFGVSRMLDLFGVYNQVNLKRDGRPNRLDGWTVQINHRDHILNFRSRIGFISDRKNEILGNLTTEEGSGPVRMKYRGCEYLGDMEVYDIQTADDGNGSFVVDGVLVHNCFVLPIEDSIDGIFDTVKDTAIIQKAGGGTGFSFDKLRPTGEYIKSSGGTTSGPISFWKVLSEATNAIQQGAFRRGANMGMMTVTHPDILKFIHAKQDLNVFNNYNISVKIPELWMLSYDLDPEGIHVVTNTHSGKRFIVPRKFRNENINIMNYGLVDLVEYDPNGSYNPEEYWTRKQVFDVIVDCAWRTGEPGLIFIDEINAKNPTPHIGEIEATNPCVTGETKILTNQGFKRIDSLVDQRVGVWNGEEWSTVTPSVTGENQDLLRVAFSDGSSLDCTPYHSFYLQDGAPRDNKSDIKVEAKYLKPGHRLASWDHPVISGEVVVSVEEAYTHGFFSGDGSSESGRDRDSVWLYGEKKDLLDKLKYEHANECGHDRIFVSLSRNIAGGWRKSFVPPVTWDVTSRMAWLAGLVDSDGSVTKDGGVQIWSVDKDFLQEVKEMLFISGTHSSIIPGKSACRKMMPDGLGGSKEYSCQESWRLLIPLWGMSILKENGLECHRVDISRDSQQKNFSVRVVSVDKLEKKAPKVYCFTEPKRHRGVFGCIGAGNCGEQPLLPYEACNLGSIDVSKFVVQGKLDEKRLRAAIRHSVRFLEDIIEINPYPIPQIDHICKSNRKIGLGLMGFADALFNMGIAYNTEAGVNMGRHIMKIINEEGHKASGALASERGNFPNYVGSMYDGVKPMRNSAVTTVAPTGTISIIADCSGGIEPLFSLAFKRQVLNGKVMYEVNKHFKKVAQDRGFYSEEMMDRIIREGSVAHIDEVPQDVKDLFVCTHDISPEWHVKMQAAFQEHCDSSISKTINFTEEATRADVMDTYMLAWKLKCKGITVYRNNCRASQPMSLVNDKKKEEVVEKRSKEDYKIRKPLKTPDITTSVRLRQNTPFGHMHVNVSVDPVNGKESEVFAQLGKAGDVMSSDLEAICRLASLFLRMGGDMGEIVNQLEGIGSSKTIPTREGTVGSLADALAKALTKYRNAKHHGLSKLLLGELTPEELHKKPGLPPVTTGSPVTANVAPAKPDKMNDKLLFQEKCPSCGARMIFVEKCLTCEARCGYSKCS